MNSLFYQKIKKMKQVKLKAVASWHANEIVSIDILQVNYSKDNLVDSCEVSYSFISTSGAVIAEKTIEISGDDYKNWDGNIEYVISKILENYNYKKV